MGTTTFTEAELKLILTAILKNYDGRYKDIVDKITKELNAYKRNAELTMTEN